MKTLPEQVKELILRTINQTSGEVAEASRLLGVSRSRFYTLLKTHKINLTEIRNSFGNIREGYNGKENTAGKNGWEPAKASK